MQSNLLTKRVMGFVFSLSLLLGIGVAASSQAHAQYRDPNWQRDQNRRQRDWERDQRRRDRQSDRDSRRSDRNNRDYRSDTAEQYNWGGSYELRQTALNAGYNEGIKDGRTDRSRGERFEYRDESDFRNANKDYNSRLGSRELYAQYFRQGFANGYTDGYRGY